MPIVPDADEVLLEQLRLPDQPKSRRKPRARHVPFVQLQLPEAVAAFRVLKCPQAAVWLYINYRVWADGIDHSTTKSDAHRHGRLQESQVASAATPRTGGTDTS